MNEHAQGNQTPSGQRHPDGAAPPVETLDLARSLLSAHHAEESAKRYRQRADAARFQDKARALALAHVQTDGPGFRQLEHERRQLIERRLKLDERVRDPGGSPVRNMQPLSRSGLTIAVPPYDFDWVSGNNPGFEHADRNTGNYDMRLQSIGSGAHSAAAGVGFWFFSGNGNPMQRFAALTDYSYVWWDSAAFYVAHNSGHTRLWVFGASEKTWVARSDQTPSWADGVGWLEEHGNAPGGEDGTVSNQAYFNAAPNSWYQCWAWSTADVYADSGFWGFAASSIDLKLAIRLAVLGDLG